MWHFLALPRPNDKFGGISEETTRDICWRIGFLPSDDIQNLVAQLCKAVSYREDVMVCAAYPNCAVVLELVPAEAEPCFVPFHHIFLRLGLVPFALIHAYYLATLHGYAAARKKIRRVGKYHVKLEIISEFFIYKNSSSVLIH